MRQLTAQEEKHREIREDKHSVDRLRHVSLRTRARLVRRLDSNFSAARAECFSPYAPLQPVRGAFTSLPQKNRAAGAALVR